MITELRKKFPIMKESPKLTAFFGLSSTVLFFGIVLFLFTNILPATKIVEANEAKWVPQKGKYILEVNIANNGMIFIKGAKVESISGNTIIVSTIWNVVKLKWTIETNESYYGKRHFGTSFLNSKGEVMTINNISVGSIININGVFNLNYEEPTVKANFIRIY